MGGSGGGRFPGFTPSEIRAWIEQTRDETATVEHDVSINEVLSELLVQYNDRDVESVREHLDEIQEALEDILETTIDLRFGGSVAKHTYIDGLSDVDATGRLARSGNAVPSGWTSIGHVCRGTQRRTRL